MQRKVDSFKDYAEIQKNLGETPTPENWWSDWLTEQDRAFIISRLQESDARYVRQYGLARNWGAIPERQQFILINI